MSRPLLNAIAAACAIVLPTLAHSRPVTLSVQLNDAVGDGAYLAVYLTDPAGGYVRTLWVAGGKAKYHKHLADWQRLSAGDDKRLQGVTGASVGAGRTLTVSADLADVLFDAGYEIRVDAAVEDLRDSPADARLPLSLQAAGKPAAGRRYVRALVLQAGGR